MQSKKRIQCGIRITLLIAVCAMIFVMVGVAFPAKAASTYTLYGMWEFNSTLTAGDFNGDGGLGTGDAREFGITFSSNGTTYYDLGYFWDSSGVNLLYRVGTLGGTNVYRNRSWTDESYRIVNFGIDGISIPGDFYDWFTANATKVTHTLTFNANGGTFGAFENESITVQTGTNYDHLNSFPSNPTRDGYTFAGWYTSSTDGSEVTASMEVEGTVEESLYAHWTPGQYLITLDAQSGSGGPSGIYAVYNSGFLYNGATITSVYAVPSRAGYTFDGYYTGKNGSGTKVIDASGKIVASNTYFTANTTAYAKWTVSTDTAYRVKHYRVSSGVSTLYATANKTGTTGASLTLKNLAMSITGYT